MPPPSYPPLCVASYDGDCKMVQALLASGAWVFDPQLPLQTTTWAGRGIRGQTGTVDRKEYEESAFEYGLTGSADGQIALSIACHMGRPEAVRALLTEDLLQLEVKRPYDGFTPLLVACAYNLRHSRICPNDEVDRAECVRLLLDAGMQAPRLSLTLVGRFVTARGRQPW